MPRSTDATDVGPPSLLSDELARMYDRQQIVELHDRYAAMLDAIDYEALSALFTADAVVEGFPEAPFIGAETIARRLGEISTHHVASQRMITNHRIAFDGDRARVVAAFRSAHLDTDGDDQHHEHSHEGWYLSDVARTADGWRFARLKRVNLADVLETSPTGAAIREEVYRTVDA